MIEVKREDGELSVIVSEREIEVHDVDDSTIMAECNLCELKDELTTAFPHGLTIQVHSEDGFGTFLFHSLFISQEGDGIGFRFACHHPNKYWEGRFGLATLLDAIAKQTSHFDDLSAEDIELEDDWKQLTIVGRYGSDTPMLEAVGAVAKRITKLVKEAEVYLAGIVWKKEYENNETLFCTEILAPLLRRMGFLSVRYTHGNREYGKDFTFSEMTPFGDLRHYGLQAKAGDLSGGVSAQVDEILGQINDAFAMPYVELGAKEPRYISSFIVAISGKFTSNAKEKIAEKTPRGLVGSVYFLDRERIIEFIERFWMGE